MFDDNHQRSQKYLQMMCNSKSADAIQKANHTLKHEYEP